MPDVDGRKWGEGGFVMACSMCKRSFFFSFFPLLGVMKGSSRVEEIFGVIEALLGSV